MSEILSSDPEIDASLKKSQDHLPSSLNPAIKPHCADHGFERIGQDRRTVAPSAFSFSYAQLEKIAQLIRAGDFMETLFAYQIGSHERQVVFCSLRVVTVEFMSDHVAEYSITKKLQSFVVRAAVTSVCECQPEQRGILELIADSSFQLLQLHLLKGTCSSRRMSARHQRS